MEIIKVDNNAIETLLDILDFKNPKCASCGKSITKDNFGIITNGKLACNNELCLIEVIGD